MSAKSGTPAPQPKKTSDGRYVGTIIPAESYNCLRIEALLQGVTLGALMRNILVTWFEVRERSEEEQINRFATHLYSQWDLRYRDITSFVEYYRGWKQDLVKKHKLSIELANRIIDKCREQGMQT